MGVLINSAAFKYRERDTDPWQTLGIMADVDLESMADKFDTTSTYTEGELVMHGGYLYKCNAGGAGPGAWDVTEWTQTSVETELDHLQDLVTGDVMANFAANYNARTAYTIGKYCIHDGKLYRCIVAIPSPGEAWTAGHWASTNISNQVYNTIIKLSNQYNPARTYKKDEVCIYGDALKYCKIDMTQPEAWDFSHWGTVTGVMDVVGSGQLDSGFAADNLTGAANELRNTLTQLDGRLDTAEDDIDDLETETAMIENGIAVIVDGDKTMHPNGARRNSFVLVKNSTITGLIDGIYIASKSIPYNTNLDASYFVSCQFGALNQRPYYRWYTGINAASYQNDDLKRATLIMAYVGSPTAGNNSTTTIWDFIGDGTSARVSNNDVSGSYQLAYIVYNKNTGTVNAGNGVLLAVFAIFDLLPDSDY